MRRSVALLLAIPLTLTALVGCSAPKPVCVPRITVTPGEAHAGDTVTVESPDVCEVTVPRDGWRVVISPTGDRGPSTTVTTTEAFDGSFSAEVTLPDDIPAGAALAGVENWDYSTCDDSASCVGPYGALTILAR
jgi:hypothetical protein